MHNKLQSSYHLLLTTLLFVALIIIGTLFYGDALRLPISLIDDIPMLDLGKIVTASLKESGAAGLFTYSDPRFVNNYRPCFDLIAAGNYLLANIPLAHAVHLGFLALTCLFMILIPFRAVGPGQTTAPLLGSWIGALLFLTAEIPGITDFQSLHGNWFRLFTTDSYAVTFAVAGCFAILCAWRGKHWWSVWPLMILGALLLLAVILTKLTFAPIALILIWVIFCATVMRKGNAGWSALISLTLVVIVLIAYAGETDLILKGVQGSYTGQYGQFSDWHKNYGIYTNYFLKPLFGPILLWIMLTLLLKYNRIIRLHPSKVIGMFFAEGMILIGAGAFFVGYLAWPHIYARYMLGTVMFLCLLTGMMAGEQLRALFATGKLYKNPRNLLFILIGAMIVFVIPTRTIALAAVFLIITFWRSSGRQALHALLFGMLLLGTAFMVKSGQVSNRAVKADYLASEMLRYNKVIPHIHNLWKEQKMVGIAVDSENDLTNEIVGAACELARQKGITPRIAAVTDLTTTASKCDVLLYASAFSPEKLRPSSDDNVTSGSVLFELDNKKVAIPVKFGIWSSRIMTSCGKEYSLIEDKPINDEWGFYYTK